MKHIIIQNLRTCRKVNFKITTVLIEYELTCKLYIVGKIIKLAFQYILQSWIWSSLKEVMTNSLHPVQTQDKMQKCQIRNKYCIDWARSNVHAIYHWKDNWVSFPINFTELNLTNLQVLDLSSNQNLTTLGRPLNLR